MHNLCPLVLLVLAHRATCRKLFLIRMHGEGEGIASCVAATTSPRDVDSPLIARVLDLDAPFPPPARRAVDKQ